MRNFINKTIDEIPFSGIRKFFDVAAEMEDVVSLGVGEPDFYTPWNIREEAIFSLENRRTVYSSNSGILELRKEISKYLYRVSGTDYDPASQIIVTVGGSEAIDIALRAVLEVGDEVLLVEPCYVSYMPCIVMAGGVPISVPTKAENNFRLVPEDIINKITDKTKVIIISFPNNPTGAIMEKSDLDKIAKIIVEKDLLCITDEIYAELTYTETPHFSIANCKDMYERTIIINGFSKAYAMTGWRLGYAAGPKNILNAMLKIHQYVIMCAPTVSQYAGIEALKNGDKFVKKMKQQYDERRRVMLAGFEKIGIECFEPLGAFYLFPSIEKFNMNSDEFCTKLLYDKHLAIVPGTAFGACGDGFVRCSYAYSIENLQEALKRLGEFVDTLN